MSIPPLNAVRINTADVESGSKEYIALCRQALASPYDYIYERGKELICTHSKWWNDDDLKEDGYD